MAALLAGGAVGAYGFAYKRSDPPPVGDSYWVSHGAHTIVECLRIGIHSHCDRHDPYPGFFPQLFMGVGPYPPPQYGVAIVAQQVFGASIMQSLHWMARANVVAFWGLLGLAILLGVRMRAGWGPPLLVLVILLSPLTQYAYQTAGEALTTLLVTGLAVAAAVRARWWVLLIAAFLATVTKDTVFPFTLAIGLTALWATGASERPLTRRDWLSVVGGVGAGVVFMAAFNYFRYGVLYNADYTRSSFQVHDFGMNVKYFFSILFSPNGGLLFFWTIAMLLLGAAGIFALRGLRREGLRSGLRAWLPAIAMIGIVVANSLVLSRWWSPFGWTSWGPRLSLSLMPAAAFIVVSAYRDQFGAVIRWLMARRLGRDGVLLSAAFLAIPSAVVEFYPKIWGDLFQKVGICTDEASSPAVYQACTVHRAWSENPVWLNAVNGITTPLGALIGGACVVAAIVLVVALRAGAQADDEADVAVVAG